MTMPTTRPVIALPPTIPPAIIAGATNMQTNNNYTFAKRLMNLWDNIFYMETMIKIPTRIITKFKIEF